MVLQLVRSVTVDDPLVSTTNAGDASFCLADGPRTLVVDLAYESKNWVCFPGLCRDT